jgi:hypothetical protein
MCQQCRKNAIKSKLKQAIEKAQRYGKRNNLKEVAIIFREDQKGFAVCSPEAADKEGAEVVQYYSLR